MHYFNETPTYYLKLSISVITASRHIEYMDSGTIEKPVWWWRVVCFDILNDFLFQIIVKIKQYGFSIYPLAAILDYDKRNYTLRKHFMDFEN